MRVGLILCFLHEVSSTRSSSRISARSRTQYTRILIEKHLDSLLYNSKNNDLSSTLDDLLLRGGSTLSREKEHTSTLPYSSTFASKHFEEVVEEWSSEETDDEGEAFETIEYDQNPEEIPQEPTLENYPARPIIYRYFGRSRVRDDTVPIILLGPNVDHWRGVGESLASMGFNVIACQRVIEKNEAIDPITCCSKEELSSGGDGAPLVQAILEALRWPKAIVVGYGNDAITAIQAASSLSSQIIAGTVLCGDLSCVENIALASKSEDLISDTLTIDEYVKRNIAGPSMIVWEGHELKVDELTSEDTGLRTLIVGGTSTPHRKLPDQFAWVLSRFVEEKVSPMHLKVPLPTQPKISSFAFLQHDGVPIFSDGMLLVAGRIVATTILYISAGSVFFYQYKRCKMLLSLILSNAVKLSYWQKKSLQFIFSIVSHDFRRKTGYLSKFNVFGRKLRNQKEEVRINEGDSSLYHEFQEKHKADLPFLHGIDAILT